MGARFASHPDYANALMAAASEIFRDGTLTPGPTSDHGHYGSAEN
jgi:hypothetical protein